jgi:hypothetical protein
MRVQVGAALAKAAAAHFVQDDVDNGHLKGMCSFVAA